MQRRKVTILLIAVVVVAVGVSLLTYFLNLSQPLKLLFDGLSRLILAVLFVAVGRLVGFKRYLGCKAEGGARSVLRVLPFTLVVLANFPFTALILGNAKVLHPEYIPLLLIYCAGVGVLEEVIFRALLLPMLADLLKNSKSPQLFAILLSSAAFGLWHLTNLFGGAGIGETLVQVVYTFWLGGMFAIITYMTGNVWLAALFHALFDFGGLIVAELGTGEFQDVYFWVFTAVSALICAVYGVLFLIKKFPNPKE